MANYCPECGNHLDREEEETAREETQQAEEAARADIEIERIRADKEIRLAKIAAGMQDAERDQELAREQGKVEGMEAIIDAATPEPETEPDPEPVIIEDQVPETEPADDMTPPEAEHEEHHERKPRGLGLWQ